MVVNDSTASAPGDAKHHRVAPSITALSLHSRVFYDVGPTKLSDFFDVTNCDLQFQFWTGIPLGFGVGPIFRLNFRVVGRVCIVDKIVVCGTSRAMRRQSSALPSACRIQLHLQFTPKPREGTRRPVRVKFGASRVAFEFIIDECSVG